MSQKICWVSWENHRRSIELSRELGADYRFIKSNETFILRHLLKTLKTVSVIYKYRNGLVVVQNPSRILAAVAALMKLIFGFPLIVDRHTNFRLGKGISLNPATWFVMLCSEFSLRVADLTIVTNDFLKELVESKGGRALVLHDKIPNVNGCQEKLDLPVGTNVLYVCTYARDEPFNEVISAAKQLPLDCHIHITGDYRKVGLKPESPDLPKNIHLLGFVSSEDYDAYLFSCDVVLVLTTSEWVILCGGYEAVAARKPLITSNTKALREFFKGKACHTNPNAQAISDAVKTVSENMNAHTQKIRDFSQLENKIWEKQWSEFVSKLTVLYNSCPSVE
ncbi:glycosyltransferase family 4 protein [Marinobacter pelagius]|uniref:Glycosyltransferase involved in cell wall bisynthesis n=1 Tax=Marinobacter pelagius TaxID=379482 RepID=A0A1I4T0D4_9GAMM|nr:glycosyltransferase family 4 protein [Marinobacter pelagius]SFM70105.1 Glycosyltransferase involved in cell wall bisynthesis [Marinobacter pelagius]